MDKQPRTTNSRKMRLSRRSIFIISAVLLLALVAALFIIPSLAKDDSQESTLQTSRVRSGDIVITANGAGTVVPVRQIDLGFRSGGTLSAVNVALGDEVRAGEVLACIEDNLQSQADLDAFFTPAGVAQAEAKVVQAQNAFDAAESRLVALMGPVAYQYELQLAQARTALAALQADASSTAATLAEAQDAVTRAQTDLDAALLGGDVVVAGETVILARADLETTRLALEDARAAWAVIAAGPQALASPLVMIGPQTTRLEQARRAVQDSYLVAPFDGTITSLSAVPGQSVGSSPVMRMASSAELLVRIYLDETDVAKAVVGNRVRLTFDAYPDLLLEGSIVTVEPVLDFVDGTPVVVAWVDLPASAEVAILSGMTVEAEVIAAEALGALLIPIQALHELDAGSFAVFVVQEDGTLLLTPVTIGLRDYANAQVLGGLQAGDVVSTGTVDTR